MRLSRSEFIVLREVLKSEKKGLSYNELLKMLRNRLSNQGLSDALKSLQVKSLVYRDFTSGKAKGSHAVYKSTAASFDAVYANDLAEFLVSSDAGLIRVSLPSQRFDTSCFDPSVTLVSTAKETFAHAKEDKEFGAKLLAAAQHVVSMWLEHRQKRYNEQSLKVVAEYEEALATYLWLFQCQMKKWAPGASNDLKAGGYDYVDPLDRVESAGSIDWPLDKYHITADELEMRKKNFPNVNDDLSRLSAEGLGKLRKLVNDKKRKRVYEEYLRSLIPPKIAMVMDFGISGEAARKSFTGEAESRDSPGEESESFDGIVSRSAFEEAKRVYGKKEPELTPEAVHDGQADKGRTEKTHKWTF